MSARTWGRPGIPILRQGCFTHPSAAFCGIPRSLTFLAVSLRRAPGAFARLRRAPAVPGAGSELAENQFALAGASRPRANACCDGNKWEQSFETRAWLSGANDFTSAPPQGMGKSVFFFPGGCVQLGWGGRLKMPERLLPLPPTGSSSSGPSAAGSAAGRRHRSKAAPAGRREPRAETSSPRTL